MTRTEPLDLAIVGGGIGGVICLKYARDAGLHALLLERGARIGGLWRDLPPWQDIQLRREDWTLGDLPIAGEDQESILRNIESWVDRFSLGSSIRLNAAVTSARPGRDGWTLTAGTQHYEARYLVAASGGHNRPVVPPVDRSKATLREFHSSQLRDAETLRGKRVLVIGGGASAYDLLDLCFTRGAREVAWVYRSLKWMRPTRRPKYHGVDVRLLARLQMLGVPKTRINRLANEDLRARYAKAGILDLLPEGRFDIERDQLIPGRCNMIANARRIARHRGEVVSIDGNAVRLSTGASVDADILLWATGYAADLGYLDVPSLAGSKNLRDLSRRCSAVFRSLDAPNLFLLAPGVLETNTSTPWAYAHAAKSIMSHIAGRAALVAPPRRPMTHHFDLLKVLAKGDRASYPFGLWYLRYLWLALRHPRALPMPMP